MKHYSNAAVTVTAIDPRWTHCGCPGPSRWPESTSHFSRPASSPSRVAPLLFPVTRRFPTTIKTGTAHHSRKPIPGGSFIGAQALSS